MWLCRNTTTAALIWISEETHMPSTEYIDSILSVTTWVFYQQPFVNILANRFMCCVVVTVQVKHVQDSL